MTEKLNSTFKPRHNPKFSIFCFVFSLAFSTFLFYQVDDIEFYAAHNRQLLRSATGVVAFVIVVMALIVLLSGKPQKVREAVALSLLGVLIGLLTVVSYALFA